MKQINSENPNQLLQVLDIFLLILINHTAFPKVLELRSISTGLVCWAIRDESLDADKFLS
jgi:hypothetical protein